MRIGCLLLLAVSLLLGGCAHAPARAPATEAHWADARFGSPTLPEVAPLFALSPAMKQFLADDMRAAIRKHGAQAGLFHALKAGGFLRIEYDASRTRTAAEAFEARAGNCLSLVLMTSALARELGLSVGYHLVSVPDVWTRTEHFVMLNGHVNISLGAGLATGGSWQVGRQIIDFQPVENPLLMRMKPLDERTVVAMFFNNRAVELLEQGEVTQAYAYLRAALRSDPTYLNALNTLAVLYRRAGEPVLAERVLREIWAAEPDNRHASANLAQLLRASGREGEAKQIEATLPPAPFEQLDRGLAFVNQGDWPRALEAFERQLRLAPDFHGLHFLLARAHWELGHARDARRHLEEAAEFAPTRPLRERYQAKLRALRQAS